MEYIGITMGDPAGIGCEIILKTLEKEKYRAKSIVFGSRGVLEFYKDLLALKREIKVIKDPTEFDADFINLVEVVPLSAGEFEVGKVAAVCGDAAYQYIDRAIKWALEKKIKAVVTAPLNKESLHLGGHKYDGHTEIFATLTKTEKYRMLLWSDKLKVVHVTTHVALREACDLIKKDRVLNTITLLDRTLKRMGLKEPKIAVAGLNPHAGEAGLFGREEILEIKPAVQAAQKLSLDVVGPLSPDVVFLKASQGSFDAVVAMYHDQGHIPMKLLAFESGVNLTIGLPIIRSSVDHGTAFDIAGQGIASEDSLIGAIEAVELFQS